MEVNSATSGQTTAAGNAGTKLANDFDNFLVLLTTQLQYQDPLDPVDSGQFTEQLVSFTQVEQSIATNKNLEQLIAQVQSQNLSAAVGFIGKEVIIETDKAGLGEDGTVKWEYTLGANTDSTKILVKDDDGRIVHTTDGNKSAGLHEFTWEAPEDTEDGIYTLEVTAKLGEENVNLGIYSKGIVTSIEVLGGNIFLASNGILTPSNNVLSVKDLNNTANNTTDNTTDNTNENTDEESGST